MSRTAPRIIIATAASLLYSLVATSAYADDDPDYAAMVDGDGKDFAFLVCSDCHAMQHVLQKRYSSQGWQSAIKRMTEDFGMAELEPDESRLIIDYLNYNYGTVAGRKQPRAKP
ncbi:MAG: hypothetical protein OSB02_08955 [Rhodospirillaceae bacterium]|nr:hypothetical protein [Rhodospirillaceae bacterium]